MFPSTCDLTDMTVVFDLDGTLVDTAPDLAVAVNHALEHKGLRAVPLSEMLPLSGHGAKAMISAGLRAQGVPVVERELTQLHKKFGSFYAANVAVKSRAFEHVPELLGTLKARGAKLAVCTNKLEGLSKALLNALDLGQYFDFIAGRDTFEESKPNPAHLTKTILATGGSLQRTVYVGDSDVDIITARDAQVPYIAVSFGYTPVPVRQLAPDVVIDHYSEFISALEGLSRSPRLLPMRACNLP